MEEIGIKKTFDNLRKKLSDYIEAQYLAENDLLSNIAEDLLQQKGVLYQEPFIEIARNFEVSNSGFESADFSEEYKKIFRDLIRGNLGVFNTPFLHQVEAVENFYKGKNVLVTTGTGSGKTECFLWPLLADIIFEAQNSSKTWKQEGIRALILYPMNALVSDQLGRLRKIIGRDDDAYYHLLCQKGLRRRVRFGMYTGRTPYAGENDSKRNKELAGIIKKGFLNSDIYQELKKIGRIPAKDLELFVKNLEQGNQITAENDVELYTRYEMQKTCPDILITNYSMLEYMLMRPIEDGFWDKTIKWLNMSEANKFLLVIDEAHMYRGAAGGEVSLLIRRLMDRLHIDSSKMKCILTSASVPNNYDQEIRKFACDLTGNNMINRFEIIKEHVTPVSGNCKGDFKTANFYSNLSLKKLQSNFDTQLSEYQKIANHYGIERLPAIENEVSSWLYKILQEEPVIKELIHVCNKGAKSFSNIAGLLFDSSVSNLMAETALENILQLGTMAKSDTGRVLIGAKVHMMFKGLQGLYACVNSDCPCGKQGMDLRLGYITDKYMEYCPFCESRMFELLMDRRCGTLYLKTFIDDENNGLESYDFLWQNRNRIAKSPEEMHLWIVPENSELKLMNPRSRRKRKKDFEIGYLEAKTGLLFRDESHSGDKGFLRVLIPARFIESPYNYNAYTFEVCPNCERDHNRVTSFKTRGNEPFANIVAEQFDSQIPKEQNLVNEGKKVLLFSDSRQRAATLARDMTIVSDGDAGRQAIFMAQKLLDENSSSDKTIDLLYYAFLKVVYDNKLHFFYGKEQELFHSQLKKYEQLYGGKSRVRFGRMSGKIGNPPDMFYQLLLKNISNSYRSLNNLGLGQVVLAEQGDAGDEMEEDILEPAEMQTGISTQDIRTIYNTWIQYLLVHKIAVFPEIGDDIRNSTLSYDRGGFGIDEIPHFPGFLDKVLKERGINDEQIKVLIERFDVLSEILQSVGRNHNRKYILAARLELRTAENSRWYKCTHCAGLSTFTMWGHCIYCGKDKYLHEAGQEQLERYSLWRQPVFEALEGKQIRNLVTEEHTAQLSHKDLKKDVRVTTEKYELAFRNITLDDKQNIIDVLSCTTTMEVGIDIGSLTSVGLRNVPPMRENYQQRAGRAGRTGSAVSSIVTYTENGPHDSWYFNHPEEIISGIPRIPWIDSKNPKLIKRHVTLVLLQEFLRKYYLGLDEIYTIEFFDDEKSPNYYEFIKWLKSEIDMEWHREKILIPGRKLDWEEFLTGIQREVLRLKAMVDEAPFIYTPPQTENNSRSNTYKLLDVLFSEGILPNYSFPRNIVNFWIENLDGIVKESPERSIDIALSEYAPGRALVVNKQTYISGGLFDYYTKFQKGNRYAAAKPWMELNAYNKKVQSCKNPYCGWFGTDENRERCPLCGKKVETHSMVRPWGFAAQEGRNIPETHDTQELSYVSEPSYSSMPSGTNMEPVGTAGYINKEKRENQKLILVNKGPDEKGFELCNICGAIEPETVDEKDRINRKRPYRIPFVKDDPMRCRHEYSNVFLGYEFNTDMLVLEIRLDRNMLDLSSNFSVWLIPALTTFAEGLALAASRELDVEFSDIKSGYRIRSAGDELYADVYLYDSLSSGAGYAVRSSELIDNILDKMLELFENCDCASSCPNCLQNFWNQRSKDNLDRFLAADFLKFVRNGKLKKELSTKKQELYISQINKIAMLQGYGEIIHGKNGHYYMGHGANKRSVVIFPAMCNPRILVHNYVVCISDRMCRYGMSEVWKQIMKLEHSKE